MSELAISAGMQVEYWDDRQKVAENALNYAERQQESWLLRAMGQLAIPIEAAMAEEDIIDDLPQQRTALPVPERRLRLVE